ncbi:peptidylprolyl isomerase [Oscillatoria sp. CS-180]|uniref:peptidylprolyl isomerase n=1 Tax=Oscillatoria sp. CS-180 TaxID=3021720 RepID=UPI00232FDDB9|nr:peptidylprolyl isomerase [Oscillatoria sp. CS-180]MDB9526210.1 peptidylprolyl isomerase [Oscillatoria sp. CS-180]
MDLLKVGDRILQSDELVPLLSKTNLLSRVIQEVIIDDAIVDISLTPEEVQAAEAEFCQRNNINSPEEANAWAQQQYGTPDLIRTTASREKKLAKFKDQTFGNEVDSYFLQRKSRLDRVIYSLIRTTQVGLAQELYFRIHDDGQSFADLAREYSEGQESKTGGLIGPVELSVPHPALAGLLSVSKPGQIWPPKRIGEWYVVVKLDKFFPAQLDDTTKQRLLDEMFQTWMREQVQKSPVSIPGADTITVNAQNTTTTPIASVSMNREEVEAQIAASGQTAVQVPNQTVVPSEAGESSESGTSASSSDPWT